MRSLVRLLKRKAMSSVQTKKANDSSPFGSSPFATGSTSVEYANPSCVETASCQSDKSNPLADLAQRVSSTGGEYEVTSAAEFLSGSKSLELEDRPEDSEPIFQTPWPFPSISLHDSNAQTDEEGCDEDEESTPTLGTFEFTVPDPAPAQESEAPVSTLFKWGTLDTVQSNESQESQLNISASRCYRTWNDGHKTPFDSATKESPAPFADREDSAQCPGPQICKAVSFPLSSNAPDDRSTGVQEMTLQKLQKTINGAGPGRTMDLGGAHVVDDGILHVTTEGLTLQNGTLELAHGLSVTASGVVLRDLALISKSSKAATLRVSKKDCCVQMCDITNPEGVGVQVTGVGSTLTMKQTEVHDCERSCVCVNRAGVLRMEEECSVRGSRSFHGISATDAGTEIWIEDTRIADNFQDGVYVTSSAHASLENCEVSCSRAFHGVAGKKFGTTVVLKNCRLQKCTESALIVEMGAKARVTECSISKSVRSPAVVADGHGSHVDILDSEIADCDVGGVLVRGNAAVKIARTHIFGSSYGNGVVVSESGSHARIMNSVIFQNCRNGVLVTEQGRVVMEQCDVSSSAAASGVFVSDTGSQALVDQCQFAKNHSSNLCADSGATCSVAKSMFSAARSGPSVLARGFRTTVTMTVDEESVERMQNDVYTLSRARITLNDKRCRNRQKWSKLKPSDVFSKKLPFSTER